MRNSIKLVLLMTLTLIQTQMAFAQNLVKIDSVFSIGNANTGYSYGYQIDSGVYVSLLNVAASQDCYIKTLAVRNRNGNGYVNSPYAIRMQGLATITEASCSGRVCNGHSSWYGIKFSSSAPTTCEIVPTTFVYPR